MPVLTDYRHFAGRHWETGTVANVYAYRGVTAPHTGQPYSEALLLGVSGGAVMGYFSFAYTGYDPQARILTRNTFAPLQTLLERLGVIQHRLQTTNPAKGDRNLVETLAEGQPAIVLADFFSLGYNAQPQDPGMWAMFPIVVYGVDEATDTAWIADRAGVPLTASLPELHAARARVKKDKFRLLTLEPPNPDKLPAAVQKGLWDCIRLYTEAPPKGSRNNFGLQAFRWWAELLTRPKARMSWAREFPPGIKLYAGLTGVFWDIAVFGKDATGRADRDLYADFLDEAAAILERPGLHAAAEDFRACAAAWEALGAVLLPDDVPPLGEARALLVERHQHFLAEGNAALERRQAIAARLAAIRAAIDSDFPLDQAGVDALLAGIADRVMALHDLEAKAVATLQAALA